MKYIKLFENKYNDTYMTGVDNFFISDVMKYLNVDTMPPDEDYNPESVYDVDVIDFFKEILLDKIIIFRPLEGYKTYVKPINAKVEDVKYFAYKELYIKVKIYDAATKAHNISGFLWYILRNDELIFVKNYDADTKPLHKEVKLKKVSEKYNI